LSCDAAIVTAAGSSKRWADHQKKEYASLEDRAVLSRAIEPFLEITPALHIVITLPKADIPMVKELLKPQIDIERILFVGGGKSRQESVRLGLESLLSHKPQIVLIHDGARPWVDRALIERVLEGTRKWGACIPVVDVSDAPKQVGPPGLILADLSREQFKLAQTPQGFLYDRILEAHRRAKGSSHLFLDDAEVYAALWSGVFTVAGDRRNRKITFKEDLP
jgi:2-C-methyl-D-erythritol 4-phosphate cytidylyltransferase/2-C-methyl-D-erythritol 2,4-cyclodiphosphate synthase